MRSSGVAAQPPQLSVPHMAMVHGAVYDAVNAIDGGHEGYLLNSRLASPFDSKEAAVAAAAHRMLLNIVPAQQPVLDPQYTAFLTTIPDGSQKTRGIAVGEAAAAAMIAARTDDGRLGPFRFAIGSTPGAWRPVLPMFVNDPHAWLKDLKPFLIDDPADFRTKGPLSLKSREYAHEFDEVKSLGSASSTTRTAAQTLAARYWAENPPATWSRIFRTLSAQEGLALVDNARLYGMLYLTAADALISTWDDKAHTSFWRPITAIREADTDGNAHTAKDENWLPLIATPPYTQHPSGHSALSASFVETLQDVLGTDKVAWSDTNNGGFTRSFTRSRTRSTRSSAHGSGRGSTSTPPTHRGRGWAGRSRSSARSTTSARFIPLRTTCRRTTDPETTMAGEPARAGSSATAVKEVRRAELPRRDVHPQGPGGRCRRGRTARPGGGARAVAPRSLRQLRPDDAASGRRDVLPRLRRRLGRGGRRSLPARGLGSPRIVPALE